ncbi:MAG: tetratricopeptide repeat protein [Deltaproteobacteria bacterium]|nr:tetratricopeptide repeat protein [Deltaproteobacteria bacterium]
MSVESSQLLNQAEQSLSQNNFAKAEKLLVAVLQTEKSPRVYYLLGQLYNDKGQFGHAISAYKKALVLDPHFVDASISLSVLYNDLGHYEEGGFIFNRALRSVESHEKGADPYLNEKLAEKHMELAQLYLKYLRCAEAESQLKQVLSLKPDFHKASLHLAQVLFKQGKKQDAIKILKDLKKEKPQFLDGRVALGLIQYSIGHVLAAVEEWEKVLEINPNNGQASSYLKIARNSSSTAL